MECLHMIHYRFTLFVDDYKIPTSDNLCHMCIFNQRNLCDSILCYRLSKIRVNKLLITKLHVNNFCMEKQVLIFT